jgi:hypothetical protein
MMGAMGGFGLQGQVRLGGNVCANCGANTRTEHQVGCKFEIPLLLVFPRGFKAQAFCFALARPMMGLDACMIDGSDGLRTPETPVFTIRTMAESSSDNRNARWNELKP